MKKTRSLFLMLLCCLLLLCGCAGPSQVKPYEAGENELLRDPHYTYGFDVSAFNANESQGVPVGQLKFGGEALEGAPVWRLAQWGCTKNLMDAALEKEDFVYTYDDGGKRVVVDTNTGAISLGINADVEYEGEVRQDGEEWPHLLVEQTVAPSGRLADLEHLYMELEFTLTEFENLMDAADMQTYHSAQFQWFVTLQNKNSESPNFNRSMWFGLGFFDRRYDYPPMFAAQDGGKEDNTGMFIYIVDSKKYLDAPVTVGNKVYVKYDILPQVKTGLIIAQQRNFLTETEFEDLELGSTNIGWEMTGNFNANVDISKMRITKVPKG